MEGNNVKGSGGSELWWRRGGKSKGQWGRRARWVRQGVERVGQ